MQPAVAFEGGLQKDATFTKTTHGPTVCFTENGNYKLICFEHNPFSLRHEHMFKDLYFNKTFRNSPYYRGNFEE